MRYILGFSSQPDCTLLNQDRLQDQGEGVFVDVEPIPCFFGGFSGNVPWIFGVGEGEHFWSAHAGIVS